MAATVEMRRRRAAQALEDAGYAAAEVTPGKDEPEEREKKPVIRPRRRRAVKRIFEQRRNDEDDLRVIPPEVVS